MLTGGKGFQLAVASLMSASGPGEQLSDAGERTTSFGGKDEG
jgi:hypothetical protein